MDRILRDTGIKVLVPSDAGVVARHAITALARQRARQIEEAVGHAGRVALPPCGLDWRDHGARLFSETVLAFDWSRDGERHLVERVARRFRVGDRIQSGSHRATVLAIGLEVDGREAFHAVLDAGGRADIDWHWVRETCLVVRVDRQGRQRTACHRAAPPGTLEDAGGREPTCHRCAAELAHRRRQAITA